jgi:hypothetical protein
LKLPLYLYISMFPWIGLDYACIDNIKMCEIIELQFYILYMCNASINWVIPMDIIILKYLWHFNIKTHLTCFKITWHLKYTVKHFPFFKQNIKKTFLDKKKNILSESFFFTLYSFLEASTSISHNIALTCKTYLSVRLIIE